ncbi:invasion associated locus B family protein [Sediminicurvatus halobius]|uniref:Invasion associated locus B family protein n=1 Tax=Sediminicurvatus halobius TaxID=2182432 RepID=A0A2U2MYD4_9GAMM|nr:invasion associated locus B family protein [Spiribacter halobius]PWG62025.1 invasion associated locus B family protein [Spiribacter halobius]UEX78715.1 invasion associated locus B family protein [Spiribacter halobius]
MRRITPLALLLALLLAVTPAIAQQLGDGDGNTEGPAGTDQSEAEVADQYEDWVVRCQPPPEDEFGAAELCEMYQQVTHQESGQSVMEVVIGYPQGEDQPVALFNLPLGMRLPPGVQLQVDDNEPIRFPVQLCIRNGCRADVQLESGLVEQMKAGTQATITIADPQGRGVQLPISLLGFTAALDHVSR